MKLLIIDASGYFHRSFHAFPSDPTGELRSTIERAVDDFKPDKVISALDHGRETFRQRIYPGYKANRPPSPEGYSESVPRMRDVLFEFGETVAVPDYEADDVIGSLCYEYSYFYTYWKIRIASRDKDLNQLICENVEQHDDVTGITYGEKEVVERWGVKPLQIPDMMGIWGDNGDNIPGVVGLGEKQARELIQYFEKLEFLYEDLTSVGYLYKNSEKVIKKLEAGKINAFMSKDLATIRRNILS